jgi:aryl-alcohol dehydrogenase-like predicted oxidoreductase
MLGAMAEAYRVLREPRYLAAAARNADFLLRALRRPDGGLYRTWRRGLAHLAGYLEDYAFLAAGLLDLAEAGGDQRYLREAASLAERMRRDFDGEGGGFYDTARDHEALIVRHRQGADGAIPSANAAAAWVLARLAAHLDRPDLREAAAGAIQAYGRAIASHPRAFCQSLAVVDFLLEPPVELALIGSPGDPRLEALAAAAGGRYLPNRIVAHHDPGSGAAPDLPLLAGKTPVAGAPALYVCRNFACRAPVTDPASIDAALAEPRDAGGPRTGIARRRPGRATAEGTAARAAGFRRAHPHGYASLGATGLTVSRLGFGGYRVDDATPEHAEALRHACLEGVNLVDTSTNYTDGGSERLVGDVLGELLDEGRLRRDGVVVVSKIGYVQGANLALAQEREAAGRPFSEMVKYQEGMWHCIHPEFLADQLDRSLNRLQLDTLDVCLLHNPEYFLSDAARRGSGSLEAARDEYSRRLGAAFAYLESQVAAGRVGWYGLSSNTAVSRPADPAATSLSRVLASAEATAGRGHHCRVLQLPLNLLEPDAFTTRNTGPAEDRTVLQVAAEHGLGVLANRPLNALAGRRLVRLADFPEAVSAPGNDLDRRLRSVAALEAEFRDTIAPRLRTEGGPPPGEWFRWAEELRTLPVGAHGLEEWEQVEDQMVTPLVAQLVLALNEGLSGPVGEAWAGWRDRYLPELEGLLAALRAQAVRRSQAESDRLAAALAPHLPPARHGEPLSRKALWVLLSTPGVSAVLLGMRHPDYVADALEVLAWPPLSDVRAIYALRVEC